MNGIWSRIKAFRNNQKEYFENSEEEISIRNLHFSETICWAGIAIFILYFIFTKIFFNPWSISVLYLFPVPVLSAFLIILKKLLKSAPFNVKGASLLVAFLYIFLIIITIILSVFPNPNAPSIYYHLFILTGPVLFILPYYIHMLVVVSSYAVFAVLVVVFKAPDIWSHELFESFTAVLFAFVVMVLMLQFRLQSDSLKSKYFKMSRMDGMTMLMNKTSGIAAGEQYLSELRRKEHFAVLFLDLDNFKKTNDTHVHLVGDKLLLAVADTLRSKCRSTDIICRFGSDEFMLLLKNIISQSVAVARVEELRKQINAISLEPIDQVTCSIGVCYIKKTDRVTMEELLEKADTALYKAKQKGKNGYYFSE